MPIAADPVWTSVREFLGNRVGCHLQLCLPRRRSMRALPRVTTFACAPLECQLLEPRGDRLARREHFTPGQATRSRASTKQQKGTGCRVRRASRVTLGTFPACAKWLVVPTLELLPAHSHMAPRSSSGETPCPRIRRASCRLSDSKRHTQRRCWAAT